MLVVLLLSPERLTTPIKTAVVTNEKKSTGQVNEIQTSRLFVAHIVLKCSKYETCDSWNIWDRSWILWDFMRLQNRKQLEGTWYNASEVPGWSPPWPYLSLSPCLFRVLICFWQKKKINRTNVQHKLLCKHDKQIEISFIFQSSDQICKCAELTQCEKAWHMAALFN